jgi:site-specific DNA-methyltransferase (adenine-specific)
MANLLQGDCAEKMRDLADNSIDAIVTDPPYGLVFMGKDWDHGVPGEVFWREALRVAKPGAHLLAFGGTRTYHRLACAIEDAGWEIRDCIMWVYGSGFSKSMDVSKAIDKAMGAERPVVGHKTGKSDIRGGKFVESVGKPYLTLDITAPATPEAAAWNGWGTCLKPACEPIVVARKPLEGTVAANCIKYGTGAINIDGCRVPYESDANKESMHFDRPSTSKIGALAGKTQNNNPRTVFYPKEAQGRFPANLIHDGSDEVLALFPDSKGALAPVYGKQGNQKCHTGDNGIYGRYEQRDTPMFPRNDSGSAARFFYCAKASRSERGEGNVHPTVKPLALMRYLVRLVTRKGGTVLDPFMGSGTTGVAAVQEGMEFVGIERDPQYHEIALRRIAEAKPLPPTATQEELPL